MSRNTRSSQPPSFEYHAPTPDPSYDHDLSAGEPHLKQHDMAQSAPSAMSIPLARTTSSTSSRGQTPASSYSSSTHRHHPYSATSETRGRPRSTTSASSRSGTEEDDGSDFTGDVASMDLDDGSTGLHLPSFSLSRGPSPTLPAAVAPSRAPAKAKAKTSHARKTSPDHIKRPPNAFIIFRSHCCNPTESGEAPDAPGTPSAKQLADLGITDHRHISRISSYLWKSLLPHEKSYWEQRAKDRKEEHARMYPNYKYKPVFRNKDEIRRRRQGYQDEMEEEKRGCEEVARALLEAPGALAQEHRRGSVVPNEDVERPSSSRRPPAAPRDASWDADFRQNQTVVTDAPPSKWTIEQVKPLASALSSLPPGAKKKRVRPSTAGTRRKQQESAPSASAPIAMSSPASSTSSYSTGDFGSFDPSSFGDFSQQEFRPHSAPTGDFPLGYGVQTRERSSHMRTSSYQNGGEPQFNYMAALDNAPDQMHYDPSLAAHHESRPRTGSPFDYQNDQQHLSQHQHQHQQQFAAHHQQQQQHNSPSYPRRQPPPPIELPYNPSFLSYYPQYDSFPSPPHHSSQQDPHQAQRPRSPHPPPSPRPLGIAQMQSYNFDSTSPNPQQQQQQQSHGSPQLDVVLSPTGTTFAFNVGRPGVLDSTPRRQQQGRDPPVPNMAFEGMKRRGTLGRTAQGGDLMLISPTSAAFGGRKFSLGRWEVRKVSVDTSFGETIQLGPRDEGEDEHGRHGGQYAPSSVGGADSYGLDGRPTTGRSDYSDSSQLDVIERESGGEGEYWRRDSKDPNSPQPPSSSFHIGQTDFFLAPDPALPNPRQFDFGRSGSVGEQNASLFNYSSFGAASYDAKQQHRPSIDALLAAESFQPYGPPGGFQRGGPSDAWMSNRVGRDSEATIRWAPRREGEEGGEQQQDEERERYSDEGGEGEEKDTIRISALSATREGALAVVQQAAQLQAEGHGGLKYIYLSKALATDTVLIEQILQSGFGVTYDHYESMGLPPDYAPETACQPTFGYDSASPRLFQC